MPVAGARIRVPLRLVDNAKPEASKAPPAGG